MQNRFKLPIVNLLPKDGKVLLFENSLTINYQRLKEQIQWKHEKIIIFGKSVLQPRLTAWYGDADTDYSYSGLMNVPLPWTPELLNIKKQVESITHCHFNSVLCNLYRDGQDSMGWHQDNEPELGIDPCIASVSFGATRVFKMRHKYDKKLDILKFNLENGTLLIMSGNTQTFWQHQITKTNKTVGARINLTFRTVKNKPKLA